MNTYYYHATVLAWKWLSFWHFLTFFLIVSASCHPHIELYSLHVFPPSVFSFPLSDQVHMLIKWRLQIHQFLVNCETPKVLTHIPSYRLITLSVKTSNWMTTSETTNTATIKHCIKNDKTMMIPSKPQSHTIALVLHRNDANKDKSGKTDWQNSELMLLLDCFVSPVQDKSYKSMILVLCSAIWSYK